MSEANNRPAVATAPLSVVLPAYNAAALLPEVVAAWAAYLDRLSRPYEILLIDDGSSDATLPRAEALAQADGRIRVFHHAARRGYGAALRTGFAAARHQLVCYATCDQQYRPADLALMLERIDTVDLVVGYRQWQPTPGWARWLGRAYRLGARVLFGITLDPPPSWLGRQGYGRRRVACWVFGVRVHDPECSFGLFRHDWLMRFPLQADGPFARIELLAKANFLGGYMTEVPVGYTPPPAGSSPVDADFARQTAAEVLALFNHPDFRPLPVGADRKEPLPGAPPESGKQQQPSP